MKDVSIIDTKPKCLWKFSVSGRTEKWTSNERTNFTVIFFIIILISNASFLHASLLFPLIDVWVDGSQADLISTSFSLDTFSICSEMSDHAPHRGTLLYSVQKLSMYNLLTSCFWPQCDIKSLLYEQINHADCLHMSKIIDSLGWWNIAGCEGIHPSFYQSQYTFHSALSYLNIFHNAFFIITQYI